MLPEVPSFVISSHALSLSLSDLSFGVDPNDQEQLPNLTKVSAILIAEGLLSWVILEWGKSSILHCV